MTFLIENIVSLIGKLTKRGSIGKIIITHTNTDHPQLVTPSIFFYYDYVCNPDFSLSMLVPFPQILVPIKVKFEIYLICVFSCFMIG